MIHYHDDMAFVINRYRDATKILTKRKCKRNSLKDIKKDVNIYDSEAYASEKPNANRVTKFTVALLCFIREQQSYYVFIRMYPPSAHQRHQQQRQSCQDGIETFKTFKAANTQNKNKILFHFLINRKHAS